LHIDGLENQLATLYKSVWDLKTDLTIKSVEKSSLDNKVKDLQQRVVELEQNFAVLNKHFGSAQRRIVQHISQLRLIAQYTLATFRGDAQLGLPKIREELAMLGRQVSDILVTNDGKDVPGKVLIVGHQVSRIQSLVNEVELASMSIIGKYQENNETLTLIHKYTDTSGVATLALLLSFRCESVPPPNLSKLMSSYSLKKSND
jgi:hypothetical protein